jgi:hypothetical protein
MTRLQLQADGSWEISGLTITPCNVLTAYLYAFRHHELPGVREHCFWEIADILWNNDQEKPLCVKHKWAEQTVRACVREKYLALGGSAGSGKSYTLAAYAIVEWLCAPSETLVLVTSTTLQASRTRIWGAIIKLLDAVDGIPIKVRDSIGSAAYVTPDGTILETAGIRLIAAEKKQTRDAVGKLIGMHNERVVLIADELSELSEAIVQAGLSNMTQNPYFRLRAASNPNSRFDAFGIWSEPAGGWDSVDPHTALKWRTKYGGLFLRFDAEQSPNLDFDEPPYPYLPTREGVETSKEQMGATSRGYMRMYRAIFFDSDEAEGIYTEAELNRSGACTSEQLTGVVKIAALDPSFTNGGDDTVLMFGELGYDNLGQYVMQFKEYVKLFDDANNKAVPRTFQIVQQVKAQCEKRGILPENLAVDATSAGNPFCDVLATEWSPQILRVNFQGAASGKRVSMNDRREAKELYVNRVSELWFVGKELIRCRQLRGIPNEMAKDMCARNYETVKGGAGLRMKVESKADFKKRMTHSPDLADAGFIMLELARERYSFLATEPIKNDDGLAPLRRNYTSRKLDAISNSPHSMLLE